MVPPRGLLLQSLAALKTEHLIWLRISHMTPQFPCPITHRITIKLQLTGKSRLIFKLSARYTRVLNFQGLLEVFENLAHYSL